MNANGNLPLDNQYMGTSGVTSVVYAMAGGSILIHTDSYIVDGDLVVTAAGGTGGALSYGETRDWWLSMALVYCAGDNIRRFLQ